MRADQLLVHRGLAASRSQAQRLIASGARWRSAHGWKTIAKSDDLPEQAELELLDDAEARYVSRGGLKLAGALLACDVNPAGLRCLDVGQSTGGFTDCLLQAGAVSVCGVDVGHSQLHPRLRADTRVLAIEGVNVRDAHASLLIATKAQNTATPVVNHRKNGLWKGFDLVVGDVSFISQTLLVPTIKTLLSPSAQVLMLVKPQFELQREHIGKGGLVADAALLPLAVQRVRAAWETAGLQHLRTVDSPIAGGDGNREFFIHLQHTPPNGTSNHGT